MRIQYCKIVANFRFVSVVDSLRNTWLAGLVLSIWFLGQAASAAQPSAPELTDALIERAREIHQRIMTIDTPVDIPANFATEDLEAEATDAAPA